MRCSSGFAEQNLQKMSEDELEMFDQIINGRHMEWDLYYYFTGEITYNELFKWK